MRDTGEQGGVLAQQQSATRQTVSGIALTPGNAQARVNNLQAPLSFWGGYDAANGRIIDQGHPCFGQSLAGSIMVMPRAKGSSSSSSVLAEAIRNGTGPAGIVLRERDLIIAIGAIVAADLYQMAVPVVVLSEADFSRVAQVRTCLLIDAGSAASEPGGPARLSWDPAHA